MRVFAALLPLLLCGACKPKERAAGPPSPPPTAPAEVRATANRAVALAKAKDAEGLRKLVDAELALRLEAVFRHARARPSEQLAIAQRAARDVIRPSERKLKREEIVQRLLRALVKDCLFSGEPELRTPRWPVKRREGWDFIFDTAGRVEHVYDAYARCRTGFNVEARFARRPGATEWKLVSARELPFGVERPPEAFVPSWP